MNYLEIDNFKAEKEKSHGDNRHGDIILKLMVFSPSEMNKLNRWERTCSFCIYASQIMNEIIFAWTIRI